MKILTITSTLNFRNFTRRATIEAIHKLFPGLEVMLFGGFKTIFNKANTTQGIRFHRYHNYLPESLLGKPGLMKIQNKLRGIYWKRFFKKFDLIFLTDPDQYIFLDYIKDQKLVYLIRDPNVLQSVKNYPREKAILQKAHLVLATSKNLATNYIPKYHKIEHPNVQYWPNCVDLDIWDINKVEKKKNEIPVLGVAGNFNAKRTDYELLEYIAEHCPDYKLQIAGKIDREQKPQFWQNLLARPNVEYLGIIPFEQLPQVVAGWDVGLITDRMDEYASYMHHNKVYQYLAMGVPVVSLRLHGDYDSLNPYVRIEKTYTDFKFSLKTVLNENQNGHKDIYKKTVLPNTAKERALDFSCWINILKQGVQKDN